ncbi:hypothetical protein ACSSS7_005652 [Eimeria intestinalis]
MLRGLPSCTGGPLTMKMRRGAPPPLFTLIFSSFKVLKPLDRRSWVRGPPPFVAGFTGGPSLFFCCPKPKEYEFLWGGPLGGPCNSCLLVRGQPTCLTEEGAPMGAPTYYPGGPPPSRVC